MHIYLLHTDIKASGAGWSNIEDEEIEVRDKFPKMLSLDFGKLLLGGIQYICSIDEIMVELMPHT